MSDPVLVRLGAPLPMKAPRRRAGKRWARLLEALEAIPADGRWYPLYFPPDAACALTAARRRVQSYARRIGEAWETRIVREQAAVLARRPLARVVPMPTTAPVRPQEEPAPEAPTWVPTPDLNDPRAFLAQRLGHSTLPPPPQTEPQGPPSRPSS